ncbi:hypothetical protein [Kitasatospora sp. MAP5-34]|uniref:hypothetical protein n=1 Tax=Kitasatospora sp. MAP5-34 TaxID=3035102 RepID=UPI00247347A8|nr:hypothetical protein [Kitasatospora sp. MAP5-34]MDH6574405.1 hypothetical protein [Kitasatospora sp. MAP5-34]
MQTLRSLARAAVLAAAVLAAACGTAPAQATDGSDVPDYAAAQQTLDSGQVHDTVSRFLNAAEHTTAPATDGGSVGAPRAMPNTAGPAPGFDLKDPVPLYTLTPDFVTGKVPATSQNALRLSYLVSRVSAADGHQAAVLLAPQSKGPGWQLAGIRDGDADVSLAERGTPQARTFSEPQIHAWYRLTENGTIEPLNQEAITSLGGKHSLALAAYQKLVTARYADKLPGSDYDRKGLAGGYGLVAQDQPKSASPAFSWQPAAGGAAALAAVGGGAFYLRRHRGPAAS